MECGAELIAKLPASSNNNIIVTFPEILGRFSFVNALTRSLTDRVTTMAPSTYLP